MSNSAQPFNAFALSMGLGQFNLSTDVLAVGLIKGAADGGVDPDITESDPRWGAGGSIDLSASEVTPGGTYPLGGILLQNRTWTLSGAVATLDADDISLAQDPLSPDNCRWGILYDVTLSTKSVIARLDLGSVINGQSGPINIQWAAAGILIHQVLSA